MTCAFRPVSCQKCFDVLLGGSAPSKLSFEEELEILLGLNIWLLSEGLDELESTNQQFPVGPALAGVYLSRLSKLRSLILGTEKLILL